MMASALTLSSAEEHVIVRAILAGNINQYETLVNKYKERAIRITYGFLRNYADATDVTQDAFIKAFKNIHKFKFQSSFYTWFYRILLNTCKDSVKKKRWTVSIHEPQHQLQAEMVQGAPDVALESERTDLISNYLHQLSFKQRSVIVLSYFENFSTQEIAQMMKISEGTVKATKFQSLKKLRQLMSTP